MLIASARQTLARRRKEALRTRATATAADGDAPPDGVGPGVPAGTRRGAAKKDGGGKGKGKKKTGRKKSGDESNRVETDSADKGAISGDDGVTSGARPPARSLWATSPRGYEPPYKGSVASRTQWMGFEYAPAR